MLGERTEAGTLLNGFVPMTTPWWVEGEELLGRLAVCHRLTPALERTGGHTGYDVRPSARRRGHATRMRAAALPLARGAASQIGADMPNEDDQDDPTPVFTYEPEEQDSGRWEMVADVLKAATNIIHGADGGHHH